MSDFQDEYEEFKHSEHTSSFTADLVAGAAAFEALKAYEQYVAENGTPDSHSKAREILTGMVNATVDRNVESKGLDFLDINAVKQRARTNVETVYNSKYA
ncbi:hypothetical protein B0O80DRAFT_495558 [Mortierella sp. GBAus27b]|nr:hypothetical protein BGX31_005459 [Mortierella sp. GBA43]KAI8358903.1 hypothetical protein B0O80DRAFT_495558 [Mortierella sp. GBAus27b]